MPANIPEGLETTQTRREPCLNTIDISWGKEFMMKTSLIGHSSANMLDNPVFTSDLQRAMVSDTFI